MALHRHGTLAGSPLLGACECSGRGHRREKFEGAEGNGLTALFRGLTQHLTWHWKKREDICRWDLWKLVLPLKATSICSASLLRDQHSASSPMASKKPDALRYLTPLDGCGRVGVILSPQKRVKPVYSVSSMSGCLSAHQQSVAGAL